MEKYKDCELDIIALFDENIDILIDEAFSNLECDSITKLSNTQWKYILSYIGFRLFPDNRLLLDSNTVFPTTKAYDFNVIYNLTVRYVILCYRYNKLPSVMGLSLILNIPITSIKNWNNDSLLYNSIDDENVYSDDSSSTVVYNSDVSGSGVGRRVSPRPSDIFKLLMGSREDVLKDIAVDSKQVVGTLAVANNEFGWNVPGMAGQQTSVRSLTAAELPKLEMSDDK